MKRKIALLLAFTLIASMFPATVAANRGQMAAAPGGVTGRLWQGETPATNVRHWDDGVVVRLGGTNHLMQSPFNALPAITGAVRHLAVGADYFGAASNFASIRLQLHNANRFAGYNFTNDSITDGAGAGRALVYEAGLVGFFHALMTGDDFPGMDPTPPIDWTPFMIDIGQLSATTPPVVTPPGQTAPSMPTGEALGTILQSPANQPNSDLVVGPLTAAQLGLGTAGQLDAAQDVFWANWCGGGVNWAWVRVLPATSFNLHDAESGEFLANFPNLAGIIADVGTDADRWDDAEDFSTLDDYRVQLARVFTGVNVFDNTGINTMPSDAAILAGFNNVYAIDWIEEGGQFFIAAIIGDSTQPGVAWLNMFRTSGFQTSTPAGGIPAIRLPIEYVTNNDTNSYQVFLTLTHHAGHGQAGQLPFRTYLTSVADARFDISLSGGPRNFHRYGTVLVGGADRTHGIRVREGVEGAFTDDANWYVVFDIVTPGFFWTNQSVNALQSHNATWEGYNYVTNRFPTGTRLAEPTRTNVQLGPVTGNQLNRNRTLSFDMNVGVTGTGGRLALDELNFRGLHIGADDRARPGAVEVDVRLYRNHSWTGGQGNVNQGGWNWSLSVENTAGWEGLTAGQRNAFLAATGNVNLGTLRFIDGNGAIANTAAGLPGGAGTVVAVATAVPAGTQVGTGANRVGENLVQSSVITVANFGAIGLEFEMHEDDEAPVLRSGMQEWDIYTVAGVGNWQFAQGRPVGAVVERSVNPDYHRTARAVLRETVAGSMPGTGAAPITFEFNEGIEVLGVRFWTNEGHFSRTYPHIEDRRDGQAGRSGPYTVLFGYAREADNFLAASINRNSVVIRPEIGFGITNRWRNAEVTMDFYLSVMPGFEHYFGYDEIEVTASANVDGHAWEETLVIAYAEDPITVDTTTILLDEVEAAAFGLVRDISINDVVVTEVEAGMLVPGTRVWLGVEGGISRSWGAADHLSLGAMNARVVGDDHMQLGPVRHDSHGTYVEIIRGSRNDGAQIVFENVVLSGRVLPGQAYNIFVAEDAVAANWDGFNWIRDTGWGVGFSRGTVRGFFTNEPFATPAFSFEGADIFAQAPPVAAPAPAPAPLPAIVAPVTFGLNSSHTTRDGEFVQAPVFVTVPNITDPNFVTSYVSARVVADLAGLPWSPEHWNAATQTATFTDGITTITLTAGSTTATVNGVPTPIVAGGLGADARIIGDRMFVPISFFNTLPLPISVRWNPYVNIADRSITITPAA